MSTPQVEGDFLVRDDSGLRAILQGAKTIAVVGLSSDRSRPSYDVAGYLKEQGYRIIPVNPNETEVLGEKAYPDLRSLPDRPDVVEIFRRPSEAGRHVDEAIAAGVKVVWMQDGVIDRDAARRAHEAGLKVVMDRCMLRDHSRLIGWRR